VTETVLGSNSEVGTLRAVIVHRPGPELQRLTPRNSDALLFDGLPWVSRAQEEHDAFTELLRSRGVDVMLLADLLTEALASGAARMQGITAAVDARRLGHSLAQELSEYLRGLGPSALARVLMAGMTFTDEPSLILPDRFSLRIEDIVVCDEGGGRTLNAYPAALVVN